MVLIDGHEGPAVPPGLSDTLVQALTALAARAQIVVAFDFDGTLAPLVDDPADSRAVDGSLPALRALSTRAGVRVALVSGRDLATLRTLTSGDGPDDGESVEPLVLIGSHGAQWSTAHDPAGLSQDEVRAHERLHADLVEVTAAHPGSRIEVKPTSVVLHTRGLDEHSASSAYAAAHEMLERHPGVFRTPGKDVLEMAVVHAGKGPALIELADSTEAEAVLFAGDDVTDERAFAALHERFGEDALTIKVGDGDTAAAHRIPDEPAALALIRTLLTLRP